ncbi:hypothetical protein RHS04_08974, partial [Rhizoctonia solani]
DVVWGLVCAVYALLLVSIPCLDDDRLVCRPLLPDWRRLWPVASSGLGVLSMFTSRSDLLVIVDDNGAVYSLIGPSSSTAVIVDHTAVGICVASAYSPVRPSSSDGVVINNGGVGAGVVSLVTSLIGPSTSPPPSLTTPGCVLFPLAVAVAVAMNVDNVHVAVRDLPIVSLPTPGPPDGSGSLHPRRRCNALSARYRPSLGRRRNAPMACRPLPPYAPSTARQHLASRLPVVLRLASLSCTSDIGYAAKDTAIRLPRR